MMRVWVLLCAMLLAAACSTEPVETPPTLAATLEPVPTQEIGDEQTIPGEDVDLNLGDETGGLFVAELTGDTETTIAGSGAYNCEGGFHVLRSASADDALRFVLPTGIVPGEYVIGADDDSLSSTLEVASVAYTDEVFGVITLSLIPSAAGEPVSGSFDMNYSAGDSTVNVVGTFDLLAGSVCPSS